MISLHRGRAPLWARAVAGMLLTSILCLTTGCGNSQRDFVAAGRNESGGQAPADGFFMGRVLLNTYAAGDQVTLEDLDGKPLYRLTTNTSGVFYSYGPLPQDFRIVAVRPSEKIEHSREIRGGYIGGTMWVHPMTTLISRLMQADPSLSLQEASDRVHDFFEIPRSFDEDWVTNSKASLFRPVVFYDYASVNGGVESSYNRIVSTLLDPTLDQSIWDLEEQDASDLDAFIKSIAGDLLGDTVSVTDAGAFGAVTQFFGLNLGTTGKLSAISEQLDAVISDLGNLEKEVGASTISGTYQTDRNAMEHSLVDITNFSGALQGAMNGTGGAPDISEILDVEDDISLVESYMVGQNVDNIIFTYAQYLLNVVKAQGISTTDIDRYQGYPVRTNSTTEQLIQNLGIYLNYLGQGVNNRAELAHMSVPPAFHLADCVADINSSTKVAFQAVAQVPPRLASDEILVDLENSHMFGTVFQPKDTYYNARNLAENWDEGGYDDWRLPNRDEIDDFVQNRIGPAHTTDDNEGWEAGFKSFGFDTTHYGENAYHTVTTTVYTNYNEQGQVFFNVDSNSGAIYQDVYQWSGVSDTPATAYYDDTKANTSGDYSTYLFYRTYANPDVETNNTTGDPLAYATLPPAGSKLNVTAATAVAGSLKQQLGAKTPLDAKGVTTQPFDVTGRTFWSSSSPRATVSNYPGMKLDDEFGIDPGPVGQITWHPPIDGSALQPVQFTGTFFGASYGGGGGQAPEGISSITGTITVQPPTGLTPNATSLQVLPFDQAAAAVTNKCDVSILISGQTRLFSVYATSFYQDGQFHDVTPTDGPTGAVYSFLDSQGNVIDSVAEGGGFIDSRAYVLVLESDLPPGPYTIRCEYTTPTGQDLVGTLPFTVTGITN